MSLDVNLARAWVEKEPSPDVRNIKQKILNNLNYVSAHSFTINLKNATNRAFTEIPDTYAVIWDYKPHSSKRWVYHKIKKYLPRKPTITTYFTQRVDAKIGVAESLQKQNITHLVIFDDAAYSGEQLINRIIKPLAESYTNKNMQVIIYIIVPYISSLALQRLLQVQHLGLATIKIYFEQQMLTLLEILSDHERTILANTKKEEFVYLRATLTYFDHRVADNHSFFEEITQLIKKSPKPYGEDTQYGKREQKEWDRFWKVYLAIINNED